MPLMPNIVICLSGAEISQGIKIANAYSVTKGTQEQSFDSIYSSAMVIIPWLKSDRKNKPRQIHNIN